MSKVIKIKESEVFGVITQIINEQSASEIKVTASGELGTYPEFGGLKTLLAQLKNNVQKALRGNIPYVIKSNEALGTILPRKVGGTLSLTVTLIPSEESKRHWYFDGSAGIYSYINTTSISAVNAKVRMSVMDKAQAGFVGSSPIEIYPNTFGLSSFTNLNPAEPNKQYSIILKFLVGLRPGGFYEVGDEEPDAQTQPKQDSKPKDVKSLKEGDSFYAIRSTDNQKYKLVIGKLMPNYNGFPAVFITGPGTYQGEKLDGTAPYDLVPSTEKPGELTGNTEMGSFKLIPNAEEIKMTSV
jgi:hypothetical protein